jgi:uncharacterized damage-inducible protein DinB
MPDLDIPGLLRIQARANRLANRRLHAAMAPLSDADFVAPRTGFFPSLASTLHHILLVDTYYIAALHAQVDMVALARGLVPASSVADLAARQAASDERLIGFCDALEPAGAQAEVAMDRGDHVQRDKVVHLLMHLFSHQIHHRGQAHSMLSGTAVAPPQLDEFMMPSEFALRVEDRAALGWSETDIYGDQAWPAAR